MYYYGQGYLKLKIGLSNPHIALIKVLYYYY
jgi:hypothetical protein